METVNQKTNKRIDLFRALTHPSEPTVVSIRDDQKYGAENWENRNCSVGVMILRGNPKMLEEEIRYASYQIPRYGNRKPHVPQADSGFVEVLNKFSEERPPKIDLDKPIFREDITGNKYLTTIGGH